MASNTVIIVTNNGEDFSCKYDGNLYVFKRGEPVPLSLEAARHIFGFSLDDKTEVFARHGLMHRSTDLEKAMEWLGQFKFEVGTMRIVPNAPALEVQEQVSSQEPEGGSEGETKEQGSAPLQPGAGGGAEVTDGTEAKPPAPTKQKPGGLMTDILPA